MKKTITLLAAVSVVSGASATVVSCSFIGDKKTKETDTTTSDKEVSQEILKKEIQEFFV